MDLSELITDSERWEIDSPELSTLIDQREGAPFLLIDCREADEHAEWRIGGDILMPLSNFPAEVEQHLAEETLPLIVYCHHGMRSLQATQYLRAKGHAQTFSLHGGIDAWVRHQRAEEEA